MSSCNQGSWAAVKLPVGLKDPLHCQVLDPCMSKAGLRKCLADKVEVNAFMIHIGKLMPQRGRALGAKPSDVYVHYLFGCRPQAMPLMLGKNRLDVTSYVISICSVEQGWRE